MSESKKRKKQCKKEGIKKERKKQCKKKGIKKEEHET